MGMKGRKNCRVIGRMSDVPMRVATAILASGPGDSIMHSEKVPRKARITHCPSCHVHLWCCNDLSVSAGEKDVCSAVTEEAGDWRFRNFERIFRRSLWGTSNCIERHGIWTWLCLSFQDEEKGCMAPTQLRRLGRVVWRARNSGRSRMMFGTVDKGSTKVERTVGGEQKKSTRDPENPSGRQELV